LKVLGSSIFKLFHFNFYYENKLVLEYLKIKNESIAGNDEEHISYCFDIYDLNGDGMISREEMLTMLKTR